MRVLVLGAYGLIGLAISRALDAAGHAVTGLGRSPNTGQRFLPGLDWRTADIATLTEPEDWRPLLLDIDVVINAAGALQDGARDNLNAIHGTAIMALVEACEQTDIDRFVQISVPGATPRSTTLFMRSKARADSRIKSSSLDWVILRPGLVIGPGAYGGTALIRALAGFPFVQPLLMGDRRVQTVSLCDLAEIAVRAAAGDLPARTDVDLVEPEVHTLRHIVGRFRAWLAFAPPLFELDIPRWLGAVVAVGADALGVLGWRSPLRSTALKVLEEDVLGDPRPLRALIGRDLSSLEQALRAMPTTLQERWFSRLYLTMPLMVATLAGFWILTGVIALLDLSRSAAVLPVPEWSSEIAEAAVVVGAIADISLGLAVLIRRYAKLACLGMIALTVFYLVAGTLLAPGLWLDPLGPLVKTLPGIILALATITLLEDR